MARLRDYIYMFRPFGYRTKSPVIEWFIWTKNHLVKILQVIVPFIYTQIPAQRNLYGTELHDTAAVYTDNGSTTVYDIYDILLCPYLNHVYLLCLN